MLVNQIKNLCRANKTTIAALERELEFGYGTIHKWRTVNPGIDKIVKIADFFAISVDELLERPQSQYSQETKQLAERYESMSQAEQGLVRCYMELVSACAQRQ
ncbi:helix-turn-helix domain-containing protein [Anaeromassilibacillus senegalensis]|uniref:helix-turn-helix domain-containing protein n=1 Tax=Anaeromassilibacillus senegalensis TaxID=1673717 RepID=UPI000682E3D0|nr:helix-turn-helix transcriptional regulator [Anaeromassilibacillus senegalensis]